MSDCISTGRLMSQYNNNGKIYFGCVLCSVLQKLPTPWKAILTSTPFYAAMIAQCGQNYGLWTLITELPSYMNKILGVNIVQVRGVSSFFRRPFHSPS